jgi:prolyl-tRNA editing enzyme YbaK/EbsC (Cys-tRNA(Pro) deacylase)
MASPLADSRVLAHLEGLGVPFEVMPCEPELADTVAFCAAYGVPLDRSANTIVVSSRRPEGRRAACVVLADTRLDVNGLVRSRLGVKKVSFASAAETAEITGMQIGGVTAFALPTGLPVWVDARVMEKEWVVLGAGSRTAKIKLAPRALTLLGGVEVVRNLARPAPPPAGGSPEEG